MGTATGLEERVSNRREEDQPKDPDFKGEVECRLGDKLNPFAKEVLGESLERTWTELKKKL